MEPDVGTPTTLPSSVRFKCSQQLSPAQWHHLTLVLAKDVKRSCKVTAYLDAKVIGSAKVRRLTRYWHGLAWTGISPILVSQQINSLSIPLIIGSHQVMLMS